MQSQDLAVIYRKGGTANFSWHRMLDTFPTREVANAKAVELKRMGYATRVHNAARLDAIGMPETYDASVVLSD